MRITGVSFILSIVVAAGSMSGCHLMAAVPTESHEVVGVMGVSFGGDTIIMLMDSYDVVSSTWAAGNGKIVNENMYVATYPILPSESVTKPSLLRRVSFEAADVRDAARQRPTGLDLDEMPHVADLRMWRQSLYPLRPFELRTYPTGLLLMGSRWKAVRAILKAQEASGEFLQFLPDRQGQRYFAIKHNGAVLRVELADQQVHFAPESSAIFQRATQATWFENASYHFTESGKALVVFPPRYLKDRPLTQQKLGPPLQISGQGYQRGSVGVLLRHGHPQPQVFPLKHEGLPLACVAEVDGKIQLFYTNLADVSVYPADIKSGEIRFAITDLSSQTLAKMQLPFSFPPQSMRGNMASRKMKETAPFQESPEEQRLRLWRKELEKVEGNVQLALAAWDAEHERVCWWPDLPSQSSDPEHPHWTKKMPKALSMSVWDYGKDRAYTLKLDVTFLGKR